MLAAVNVPEPSDLDRLAARAFAASEQERAGGWLLRADAAEPLRRLNSALPIGLPMDIDVVEDWYRSRGLRPRVMVTPESDLEVLDADLAARGYEVEVPADILVGDPFEVLDRLDGAAHRVVPTELVAPAAALRSGEEIVQLGAADGAGRATVVLQDGWSLILALEVAPEARRQGIASALVRAWARVAEGRGLYLQVRQDNAAGHALYEAAGFTRSHAYHYRRAPE
jgi:ribosomal protein S18 acetylase RimI-like enzyme